MIPKTDWIHLPVYHTVVTVGCYTLIINDTWCANIQKNAFPVNAPSALWFIFLWNGCSNWPVFPRARAIAGFTGELLIRVVSRRKTGPLSLPHPIIAGSVNAPGFKGVGVTHTYMYIQRTQLSQLVQAQPCSWEINGVESQQAFARSWAPCPPYVEQLSGGILAPPPRKNVASRRMQGVESSEAHIKMCPGGQPPKLPNQNWSEKEKQERQGCSAEVQF